MKFSAALSYTQPEGHTWEAWEAGGGHTGGSCPWPTPRPSNMTAGKCKESVPGHERVTCRPQEDRKRKRKSHHFGAASRSATVTHSISMVTPHEHEPGPWLGERHLRSRWIKPTIWSCPGLRMPLPGEFSLYLCIPDETRAVTSDTLARYGPSQSCPDARELSRGREHPLHALQGFTLKAVLREAYCPLALGKECEPQRGGEREGR